MGALKMEINMRRRLISIANRQLASILFHSLSPPPTQPVLYNSKIEINYLFIDFLVDYKL